MLVVYFIKAVTRLSLYKLSNLCSMPAHHLTGAVIWIVDKHVHTQDILMFGAILHFEKLTCFEWDQDDFCRPVFHRVLNLQQRIAGANATQQRDRRYSYAPCEYSINSKHVFCRCKNYLYWNIKTDKVIFS